MKKPWDLPEDRLASTDETGRRVYLYPARVTGLWRNRRNFVQWVLLGILIFAPWIKISGHPFLLLDIEHRRFWLLGQMFWGHDAPLLVFLFASVALTAAAVSALFGRVWCGWACPQTVFIEAFFRRIERWIEGDAAKQRLLDSGPWSFERVLKKAVKWALFLSMSFLIAHNVLALFIAPSELGQMIRSSPSEHPLAFGIMLFLTGLFAFDFGWFREQFCIIACPYGRMQSVMMDKDTVTVAYDTRRTQDCINCYKCVQVCPTGVDIRRGTTQLECIGCTACVDACDSVMKKIQKPLGLVKFASLRELAGEKLRFFRPRVFVYLSLILFVVSGLGFALSQHKDFDVIIVRAKGQPFQAETGPDGVKSIRNQFQLDLANQSDHENEFWLSIKNLDSSFRPAEIISTLNPVRVESGKLFRVPVFVRFDPKNLEEGKPRPILVIERKSVGAGSNSDSKIEKEIPIVGPFID